LEIFLYTKRESLIAMNNKQTIDFITGWLDNIIEEADCNGFIVGVSGGIDSALTSTLAANTGRPVLVLNMPISQEEGQYNRSNEQIKWLKEKYNNVSSYEIDLTESFNAFRGAMSVSELTNLAVANSASRLRMMTLYACANSKNYMVVGTGNKVEDYGIGFFTKYGDGGVDISPIADLLKSEVYELASYMGVPNSIQDAIPTDGLWNDNRSDEDQIGASYDELEWALEYNDRGIEEELTERQQKVLKIYRERHYNTKHKLQMPPVCEIPKNLKG